MIVRKNQEAVSQKEPDVLSLFLHVDGPDVVVRAQPPCKQARALSQPLPFDPYEEVVRGFDEEIAFRVVEGKVEALLHPLRSGKGGLGISGSSSMSSEAENLHWTSPAQVRMMAGKRREEDESERRLGRTKWRRILVGEGEQPIKKGKIHRQSTDRDRKKKKAHLFVLSKLSGCRAA